MNIQHKIVDGKWIAEVTNNKYAEGQAQILYLPGIGEIDKTGTEAGLKAIERLTIVTTANDAKDKTLYGSADHFEINVLTTAPKHQYQHGEIPALIKAGQELKPSQVIGLAQSLGGFGLMTEISKNAELAKAFDSIIWMAPGPGDQANTAKHLVDAGVKNWFLVCEDDTAAGTNPNVCYKLHKAILELGGVSYLTVFKAKSFKDPHVIFGVLMNNWDAFTTQKPFAAKNEVIPKMSIYQWGLSNEKRTPPIAPSEKYTRYYLPIDIEPDPIPIPIPIPVPIPEPVPVPEDKSREFATISAINISPDKKRNSFFIEITWSNGDYELVPTDEAIKNGRILIRDGKAKINLTYPTQAAINIGPVK